MTDLYSRRNVLLAAVSTVAVTALGGLLSRHAEATPLTGGVPAQGGEDRGAVAGPAV